MYKFKWNPVSNKDKKMMFWQWYLANAVMHLVNIENMHDKQLETSFKLNTLIFGRSVFFRANDNNVYCLEFADGGKVPIYYGAIESVIVTNPILGEYRLTPNVDCIPVYCTELDSFRMASGYSMLIDDTADSLSDNDLTVRCMQILKRLPTIMTGKTRTDKTAIDAVIQSVIDGDPMIVAQTPLQGSVQRFDASGQTTAPLSEFTEYQQYKLGCFYGMLGVNSVWNLKREHVAASENRTSEETARYNIMTTIDYINEQLEQVNSMFGTEYHAVLNLERAAEFDRKIAELSEPEPEPEQEVKTDDRDDNV